MKTYQAFKKGDVINFCDEEYYVIENNGKSGVVCPIGETFYIRSFYWNFEGSVCEFVRNATLDEMDRIFGLV